MEATKKKSKFRVILYSSTAAVILCVGALFFTTRSKPVEDVETYSASELKQLKNFSNLYIKDIENKYNLTFYASSDFSTKGEKLFFTFTSQEKHMLEDARKIINSCLEEYNKQISQNKKVNSLVESPPDLGILFLNKENKLYKEENTIANVTLINGEVHYKKIYNLDGGMPCLSNVHNETPEEARVIVSKSEAITKKEIHDENIFLE